MKRISLILCIMIIGLAVCTSTMLAASNDIPDEIQEATVEGFAWAKKKILASPEKWGISNIEDLENSTIGKGIQVNDLNLENLNDNSESILKNSSPTKEWRFTIFIHNIPKFYMNIGYINGECALTEFGQCKYDLVKELSDFKNQIDSKKEPVYVTIGLKNYLVGEKDEKELVAPIRNKLSDENNSMSSTSNLSIKSSKEVIKGTFKAYEELKQNN